MSDEASFAAPSGQQRQLIDVEDTTQIDAWAQKLNVSPQQIRDAVAAVGRSGGDVEEYLKGTRATTNAEKTSDTPVAKP